jgi:hypothetical protein
MVAFGLLIVFEKSNKILSEQIIQINKDFALNIQKPKHECAKVKS